MKEDEDKDENNMEMETKEDDEKFRLDFQHLFSCEIEAFKQAYIYTNFAKPVYFFGLEYKTIDKDRGRLLIQASRDAGCKTALVHQKMNAPDLSDEDKQKILKDLKEIVSFFCKFYQYKVATSSATPPPVQSLPRSTSVSPTSSFHCYSSHAYQVYLLFHKLFDAAVSSLPILFLPIH